MYIYKNDVVAVEAGRLSHGSFCARKSMGAPISNVSLLDYGTTVVVVNKNHARQPTRQGSRPGNTSEGGRVGPGRVADGKSRHPRPSPAARLGAAGRRSFTGP